MKSLADYSAGAAQGWSYDTMARMIVHDLPRQFMSLSRDAQRRVLEQGPPLTGTAWDALLAAMAEHLAELHDHPVQPWMDEPERFLDETWVLDSNTSIRLNALAFGPPRSCATAPSSTRETSMREEANSVNGSPSKPLSKDDMYALFEALSERLRRKGARANIYLVGGAVMALAFDRERITADIDARIDTGHGALVEAVHEIAAERGLATNWLNEQASSAIPKTPDARAPTLYATQYLVVTGASAEHMLAMKLEAGRGRDVSDIAALVRMLKLRTPEEGTDIHRRLLPDSNKHTRALMEDALRKLATAATRSAGIPPQQPKAQRPGMPSRRRRRRTGPERD